MSNISGATLDPYAEAGASEEVTRLRTALPPGGAITLNDDGTATVNDPQDEEPNDVEHFANLAEEMDSMELARIATDLLDAIEVDKEARKKRDKQYEEALRRTGLGDDAPGGASFNGASRAVHPMLTEAAVDFSARVMSELMPPDGPVKQCVIGDPTNEKEDRAKRIARHMNYQITTAMPSAYHEFEMGLTQCPLAGGYYTKMLLEDGQPDTMFVPIDKVHRPFTDGDFYSQQRITHEQDVDRWQFEDNVKRGLWSDVVNALGTSDYLDETQSEIANDRIIGRNQPTENIDDIRVIYECSTNLALTPDDDVLPYIVTIDVSSRRILSIYRNWKPNDPNQKRLDFLIEWPFWPWRGGYPIGIAHMIGSLSGVATGAMRALLDAAFLNNSQTGVKLKGGASAGGQNVRPQVGQTVEFQGSLAMDDIRKTYMPLEFPPPNPVLFQLLGFVVDAGRGVVRTTFDEFDKFTGQTPVGTANMMIEQGLKNFGAVHGRLHRAMKRFLKQLYDINARTVKNEEIVDQFGELLVTREDYNGPMCVIPVSDPRIFSDMQRQAQGQLVATRAQMWAATPTPVYKVRNAELFFLKSQRIPQPEDLLIDDPKATQMNAVAENVTASRGLPILPFPGQDHEAHLATHAAYMQDMLFGANPIIAQKFLPIILGHLADHMGMWYADATLDAANAALRIKTGNESVTIDSFATLPGVEASLDRLLAELQPAILGTAHEVLKDLPALIAKAQMLMKQLAPPTPMDPSVVAMRDVDRQTQADQAKTQLQVVETTKKAEQQERRDILDGQKAAADNAREAARLAQETADAERKAQQEAATTAAQQQQHEQDAQQQAEQAEADRQIEEQRVAVQAQGNESRENIADGNNASRESIAQQHDSTTIETTRMDNETAESIAKREIAAGKNSRLSTGASLNK